MVAATSLLVAIIAALPLALSSPILEARSESAKNASFGILAAPKSYSGPWQNFPAMDTWLTFDDMFSRNVQSMKNNGDTSGDTDKIKKAILDSAKLGVDERVILGIIMQESHGDVGVITTYSPGDNIPTAGIMQCSNCQGFPGKHGLTQDQITAMVRGGTQHFKQNLQNWGNKWSPESIYPALREYNSGSVNPNNLSDPKGATASYVSDIAQRLQGWVN